MAKLGLFKMGIWIETGRGGAWGLSCIVFIVFSDFNIFLFG